MTRVHKLLKQGSTDWLQKAFLAAFLVVLLGIVVSAQSAISFIDFEAEQGTLTGQVAATSDPTASGGSYIGYTASLPPPTGVLFSENFSTATSLDRFTWQVWHGDDGDARDRPDDPGVWQGDHNLACQGPTTSRDVHQVGPSFGTATDAGEVVWWCAPAGPDTGHFMTSGHTAGYMHIDFAPAQSFSHVSKVCWDQNLTDMPTKWTQVTVVSEGEFQSHNRRLNYATPEQQAGPGRNGILLAGDTFMFEMLRGSTQTFVGQTVIDQNYAGLHGITDEAKRYRHCLTDMENGNVRIDMYDRTGPGSVETRTQRGGFTNGPARVIFQDTTYDPDQAGPDFNPEHLTWHWDNITVE